MAPEAQREDLLYVSNVANNTVTVYGLTDHKLVGTLTGISVPQGVCADTNGNVWVVAWGTRKLIEYAHAGTKPLKILTDSDPYADLYDCSVDPTTGNLAVTNWGRNNWYQGNVLIYSHGSGNPNVYYGPGIWFYYGCSYDAQGNLFADGWDAYANAWIALGELRKGSYGFKTIYVIPSLQPPLIGGVRWDGKQAAVGNWESINEYRLKGAFAYFQGNILLTFHWPVGFFWIANAGTSPREIIAPDSAGPLGAVQYWRYPTGGNPIATITDGIDGPFAVTVSYAPN